MASPIGIANRVFAILNGIMHVVGLVVTYHKMVMMIILWFCSQQIFVIYTAAKVSHKVTINDALAQSDLK